MRRLRLAALLATSTLAITGCLPNRDNGADPSIRPSVTIELSTSERGPGGDCLSAATVTTQVTRSQCLTVRASGTDPQGNSDVVGYAYSLLTTSGELVVRFPTTGLGPYPAVTIKVADYEDLRSSAKYDVVVDVADVDGHHGENRERLLIRNTPPVAIAPGTRLVPHWGGAWRTSGGVYPANLTLHFSGAGSFDADGDALLYRWELKQDQFPVGTDVMNAAVLGVWSSSADIALVVPADPEEPGGVLLELQVTDSQSVDRAVASAQLDAVPAWAVEEGTGKALILDVNRAPFVVPDDFDGAAAFLWKTSAILASELLYRDETTPGRLNKAQIGLGVAQQQVDLGGEIVGIFPPPVSLSTAWFWAITTPPGGGTNVHAIGVDILGGLVERDSLFIPSAPAIFGESFGVVDPNTGDLWFGQLGGERVIGWEFDEQGPEIRVIDSFAVPEQRLLTSIAMRRLGTEGASQVWVALGRNVFGGNESAQVELFVKRQPDVAGFAKVDLHYPLEFNLAAPPEAAFGMQWATAETAWLNLFGQGMASFEPCNTEMGLQNDSRLCMVTLAPDFPAAFEFVMNRKTGTNLGINFEGHTFGRITIDGTYNLLDTESTIEGLIGPDPKGRIWTMIRGENSATLIHRGNGAGLDGRVLRSSLALGFGRPTIDFSTGDLWAPSIFPAGGVRYYADGRVGDVITGVSAIGSASTNLAPPNITAPDPETGALWIVTGGGGEQSATMRTVYLADPYAPRLAPGIAPAPPGVRVPVFDVSSLSDGELIGGAAAQVHGHALVLLTRSRKGDGIGPSPCRNDTPMGQQRFHYYLRRLSPDGSLSPPATMRGVCAISDFESNFGDDQVAMSRDLVTGEVCVAARKSNLPRGVRIARFGSNLQPIFTGVAIDPTGGTMGDGLYVEDLAAAPGQCWLGVNQNDGGDEEGRVFLATASAVTGSAQIFASSFSLDLPLITTVRPSVGATEAQLIKGATRAWVGGEEAPLVPIIFTTGTFGLGNADILSATFETEFLQP